MRKKAYQGSRQVSGVQIAAYFVAVAMDADWPTRQCIAQEAAGGELVGQGQVGADEGKAAGNYAVEVGSEEQGFAALLEQAVGRNRCRVGGEVFPQPLDIAGLTAIHCARTGVEYPSYTCGPSKTYQIGASLEAALHDRRTTSADFCCAWRGEVDQVVEAPGRKLEPGRLANNPVEIGTRSEMRDLGPEAHRITAEQGGADIRAASVVGGGNGLQQPLAVEARGTGDEEAGMGKLRPEICRVRQDVLTVFR